MSSSARSRVQRLLEDGVLGALAGLLAFLLLGVGPSPAYADRNFHLVRPIDDPLLVSERRPLTIPYVFGDFDLIADVEVPEGGSLDLCVRVVEPRRGKDGDMPLFHGRFTTVRLSADGRGDGPAFRSREDALFELAGVPGQVVAAGLPTTVVVEARGRELRANTGGVEHGPFLAMDSHGFLAFVVRGGTAVVRSLRVDVVPRPVRLLPWAWCGLIGAGLGIAAHLLARGRTVRVAASLSLVPLAALGGSWALVIDLLPESEPAVSSLVALALAGAPAALLCASARSMRSRLAFGLLGLASVPLAWSATAEWESHRLASLEDPRLDACFGALSATAPLDALARRLHGGTAVHMPEALGARILFLGGGQLFEGHPDREQWVAPFVAGRTARQLRRAVDFAVVPTLFGHTRQQVEMYLRFYRQRFDTAAVVLAIPPWEGEASEDPAAVAWLDDSDSPAGTGSGLWTAWNRRTAPRVSPLPRSGVLRDAVGRLAAAAQEDGTPLVVVLPPGLDPELAAEVEAGADGVAVVLTLPLAEDPAATVEPLADAVAKAMGGGG
ncbi:MAG: hypothetical protein ACO4CT_03790 [Planctomycetota bacterium]